MASAGGPRRRAGKKDGEREIPIGAVAIEGRTRLHSYQIGALPLLNHYFRRLELTELFQRHFPADDPRQWIPTERVVRLLVANVLVSRQPMYAIPEWAARHSPDLFDLFHQDIATLSDDRLGSCLARLFDAATPTLLLAIVARAIEEFDVSLDELHNDSTSVSFHGEYRAARKPMRNRGGIVPAITWGHSKDRRPDLKQLLFTLTVASDGGIPLCFQVDGGNTTDDTTHRRTWDLLASLAGGPDFLYVADCKLASRENLHHIAARGGRFLTVLPAARREDVEFRRRLREEPSTIEWVPCWVRIEEPDDPLRPRKTASNPDDRIRVCAQEDLTADGYRLFWFHSERKAALDLAARTQRCQRALLEVEELQTRLSSPRTRFRQRGQVQGELEAILENRQVAGLLQIEILQREDESFRKEGPGRPAKHSTFRREVKTRFALTWRIDDQDWRRAQIEDGVFPLLTNDRSLSAKELLQAYKRQPKIEKRFGQLKSDYELAPVFLKSPERVVGLFTIYFLALLVQALIERDLRQALEHSANQAKPNQRRWEGSIDVYPEGRRTRRPTARYALDLFENVRRYDLLRPGQSDDDPPLMLFDELTPTQQRLLTLLGIDPNNYGK